MRFVLARMFLLERPQIDAFERTSKSGLRPTREEWLRSVFGEVINFSHRQAERKYNPDHGRTEIADLIIARIGRETSLKDNDPEDNLRERVRPIWRACLVIIDPKHHGDGQKVAIETSTEVGSAFGNFKSLVTAINARVPPEPYLIELHAISDQTNFWEYVKQNRGNVTSITLEVSMPNMFGGESSFEEDVKALRDREKARHLRETIENPDGLDPETERMRAAVSYATRGGGRVKAKAKNALPYDSQSDVQHMSSNYAGDPKEVEKKTDSAIQAFRDSGIELSKGDEK